MFVSSCIKLKVVFEAAQAEHLVRTVQFFFVILSMSS